MKRSDTAELYFEAHITLDPVDGARRYELETLANNRGWRLAKLLMEKGGAESTLDSFVTTRDHSLAAMQMRVSAFVSAARFLGFTVRRYKIEDTVLDSRTDDVLLLLEDA